MLLTMGGGDDRVTVGSLGPRRSVRVRGESGDDRLTGGPGDDILVGGIGDDRLVGGAGADDLVGGPGADALDGGPAADRLRPGAGADRAIGGTGDDRLVAEKSVDGPDTLSGGLGFDVVTYRKRTARVRVDLAGDRDDGAVGERDRVDDDVEGIVGGLSPYDRLVGDEGSNYLDGGDYPPRVARLVTKRGQPLLIAGRSGADLIVRARSASGGPGNDIIVGVSYASDVIDGGSGSDLLDGSEAFVVWGDGDTPATDVFYTRDREYDDVQCAGGRAESADTIDAINGACGLRRRPAYAQPTVSFMDLGDPETLLAAFRKSRGLASTTPLMVDEVREVASFTLRCPMEMRGGCSGTIALETEIGAGPVQPFRAPRGGISSIYYPVSARLWGGWAANLTMTTFDRSGRQVVQRHEVTLVTCNGGLAASVLVGC